MHAAGVRLRVRVHQRAASTVDLAGHARQDSRPVARRAQMYAWRRRSCVALLLLANSIDTTSSEHCNFASIIDIDMFLKKNKNYRLYIST